MGHTRIVTAAGVQDVLVEQSGDGKWYAVPQTTAPGEWPVGAVGDTAAQALSALAACFEDRAPAADDEPGCGDVPAPGSAAGSPLQQLGQDLAE